MGRRKVVEITCDRCGKTETQSESEVSPADQAELTIVFKGETTAYEDLCKRCRGTVENYVVRLRREKDDTPEQTPDKQPTGTKKGFLGLAQ